MRLCVWLQADPLTPITVAPPTWNHSRVFTGPTRPSSFARGGQVRCRIHPREEKRKSKTKRRVSKQDRKLLTTRRRRRHHHHVPCLPLPQEKARTASPVLPLHFNEHTQRERDVLCCAVLTLCLTEPPMAKVVYFPVKTPLSSKCPTLIWMAALSLAPIKRLLQELFAKKERKKELASTLFIES